MKSLAVIACLFAASVTRAEDIFTSRVEPLLKQRCFECHSHGQKIKGGLALDSKSGWEKGGESGPAIVPGKPEASLLMQALSHAEKDIKMPPKKMLPASEIAVFAEWIQQGAPDPRVSVTQTASDLSVGDTWEAEFHKRLDWWSLKPMRKAGPPSVYDPAWSKEPVDRFVRAALATANLQPAPPADPGVLRRRLAFVLTGLPPPATTPASDEAYVDMLLQSPAFGEHFARHWMDVVRYTDTYGYEWDNPAKGAYEYRDYLIRAFNDDIGFDQFLREQIAGDLLPKPRIHPASHTNESLIAPMFYHLGEHRHGSSLMFNGIHQEMVNNKIDAFSKAFLATTVACARCHDHKLEAVSQHDYYALAAIFTTPRWTSRVVDAPETNAATIAKLKDLRASITAELALAWRQPLQPAFLKQWAGAHASALSGIGAPLAALAELSTKATEWHKARAAAQKANASFKPLADPAKAKLPAGWVVEGEGLQHGFVQDATPLIALEGEAVVARLLPRGWHTHALSSKLPGSLRMPPQHLVPGKFVSLDLAGGEFGGQLVVDDHAFQNETITLYTNVAPAWKTFGDAELKNGVQQVTVEFATSSLNPNFPPRTGLAKGLKSDDFGYDKRSWLSICGIVSHDTPGAPQDEQTAFAGLYEHTVAAAPTPDPWERIAAWLNSTVSRWCSGKTQPGDQPVLDWLLSSGLLPNKAEPGSKLAHLLADYRSIEASIAFPRTVNSMDERETVPASYPLNVRGNVDVPGALVHPGFLKMLDARAQVSDRRSLAESLLSPEHPLTARVYVNRVWQWLFGTGLVATPDDFGRLGDRPSHPELLDWLAREFIREGWSTKKLVRRLVLSQTFRQSGLVTTAARERDPDNRLVHHYPTRRLEAEAIRDSLLAISGRLDPHLYGRPVLPFRSAEDAAKRLFSGPLDGSGRRSIYLQMSIMDPPKFLVGFNLPDLKLPTGRRDVTNVPSQALIMLNDPLVNEMAKSWAAALSKDSTTTSEDRLRQMFRQALNRDPDAAELARWTTALQDFGGDTPDAWERLAHAFFNTKEFIYYR
ncbi:PSD1 and planctomycete cytochrome C domain-containing protein [Prosthecobacter sp.]|uniref:PSD1 and planctomycete cytochrome C domain-containing protein n=1 Tax=Prosthecobacter sp. TaxID=1965333 RepID=UPI0037830E18